MALGCCAASGVEQCAAGAGRRYRHKRALTDFARASVQISDLIAAGM
ncbi:hypothetical protein ACS15_2214 [Ralstonia insidiosa]|uniref:Uncharacterized protein n=1 Tax=Ralstonia insidiosa TaxID=190721 RepID=A0AAC9BEQ9_9RALS|nr:hypothetical protein ACS15_2214 [Ralstonia insidiosa]